MSELSPREAAIKVIKEGGMVVVDNVMYNNENLSKLPPLEVFVKGDAEAEKDAFAMLVKEKVALEARLKSFEASQAEVKTESKSEAKAEVKEEVKEEEPVTEKKSK